LRRVRGEFSAGSRRVLGGFAAGSRRVRGGFAALSRRVRGGVSTDRVDLSFQKDVVFWLKTKILLESDDNPVGAFAALSRRFRGAFAAGLRRVRGAFAAVPNRE